MKWGTLRVVDARGKLHTFEGEPGPSVTIRLHDRALHWKLLWNPRLAVGEAYMDGTLTLEDDATIRDFLHLVGANLHLLDENGVIKTRNWLAQWVRPLQQHNPVGRARHNVAHHYDLSDDLYDLFLDPDRQYSCAYFDTPQPLAGPGPAREEAPSGIEAAARPARPQRARHRLRLGRARDLPAREDRAPT